MQIDHATVLNLVIGHPLTHSKSPLLHNTLYRLLGHNAILLPLAHQDLRNIMSAAKVFKANLLAVTMPFKEAIIDCIDVLSPAAQQLGAANTLIYRDQHWSGYNTDVDGIAYALRSIRLANKKVLLLGAGGAARAAAYYLQQQQANLLWLNRHPERANQLIAQFGGITITAAALKSQTIDVIINTTPLGMYPEIAVSPLPDYHFYAEQTVFDMVYRPLETALITSAKQAGATVISGIDMFIAQGVKQVALWRDQVIDIDSVLPALQIMRD